MHLSSDQMVFWRYGFFDLNETIVTTWIIMGILCTFSALATRKLAVAGTISRRQAMLELVVGTIQSQVSDVGLKDSAKYIGFIGTLFLFIASAALLTVVPGYDPPTGSLSTTAALAICVFCAVPLYGVESGGLKKYVMTFLQPTFIMLPFNILSELSRTLALAIRLFGNMMSGSMIVAILLTITPFIFPVVMTLLGLLIGMVQAYIFGILAAVYIAAAIQVRNE